MRSSLHALPPKVATVLAAIALFVAFEVLMVLVYRGSPAPSLCTSGVATGPNNKFMYRAMRPDAVRARFVDAPVESTPGHTGAGTPQAIRDILNGKAPVDTRATDHYGAAKASELLEKECGWDAAASAFQNPSCLSSLRFSAHQELLVDSKAFSELVDVVVPTIRDLDFLEEWREILEPLHIILVQDGDPDKFLKVPEWVDYELYNRRDIDAALGKHSWIISTRDSALRSFGFLVSKKKFVFTLDDDTFPVKGENPILMHMRNLLTNSTPYFFNTLYDPYHDGTDFVRGYPFSLRAGVPTAVSHGLWLHTPDYDAPTQLLKPAERNERHLEMTLTVPAGTLLPVCSMNLAFNRDLIGPAVMHGLMGDGQPWGRYDDMFAGWTAKTVADHLGLGVKSGAPYIIHRKASNPFVNLKKEYMGFEWQEQLVGFFYEVTLSPESNTPTKAYLELAHKFGAKFGGGQNPYFDRLARAMRLYADAWTKAGTGELRFTPSRAQARRAL